MGFIKRWIYFWSVVLFSLALYLQSFFEWHWRTNVYKDLLCCPLRMWSSYFLPLLYFVLCLRNSCCFTIFVICFMVFDSHCFSALREQIVWWCSKNSVQRQWTPSVIGPAPYFFFFLFFFSVLIFQWWWRFSLRRQSSF